MHNYTTNTKLLWYEQWPEIFNAKKKSENNYTCLNTNAVKFDSQHSCLQLVTAKRQQSMLVTTEDSSKEYLKPI